MRAQQGQGGLARKGFVSEAVFHLFCRLGGSLGDTFSFPSVLSNGLKSLLSVPQSCLRVLSVGASTGLWQTRYCLLLCPTKPGFASLVVRTTVNPMGSAPGRQAAERSSAGKTDNCVGTQLVSQRLLWQDSRL